MFKPTLGLMLLLALPSLTVAETPDQRGLAVAQEADRRDTGFGDHTADVLMVLTNRHGQESERRMRIRTLEVEGDGDKSLIIFDSPKDVKGTAFLAFTHKAGDDDQWLYLPALKRVKRISSNNKSGSFVGSEFAYEDISSQEVEKFSYNWLRDEEVEGRQYFVIERYPVDENSGYTRQVVRIDKSDYREWRVEYYDRKDSHLKTLTVDGFEEYLDEYWRPREMTMVNHQTGKTTRLVFDNYKFRTGLADSDFTRTGLQRVR